MDSQKTLPIVDRLLERSDEVADELVDAVVEATPERFKITIEEETRPIVGKLVPVTLECIACGGTPEEEHLDLIRHSDHRTVKEGLPASAVLNMIRASMVRFTSIALRHATPADAACIITVMGRSAALTHIYATTYISRVEGKSRCRPKWWTEQSRVTKQSLKLLSEGYSTCEIAEELCYSEQAISYHIGNLMRRFDCTNRTEMVSRAHEAGVLGTFDEMSEIVSNSKA
ncbi:MAG: helix-turn-helix transcriptional regulator [Rubrobacteraceae bacterium]